EGLARPLWVHPRRVRPRGRAPPGRRAGAPARGDRLDSIQGNVAGRALEQVGQRGRSAPVRRAGLSAHHDRDDAGSGSLETRRLKPSGAHYRGSTMDQAVASPLQAWESFYVIVGSSAGALTGLQFVVMTLIAGAG